MPYRSIDVDRERVARRFGYSSTRAERLFVEGGAIAFAGYTAQFDHAVLTHWLQDRPAVIDTSGGVMAMAHAIQNAIRTHDAVWVLVRPQLGGLDAWRSRLDTRPGSADWWDRGGCAVQRATLETAATLMSEENLISTDGHTDQRLVATIRERLQ